MQASFTESIIRQVFDSRVDCTQIGTVICYIRNTTEEPLVPAKTAVLQDREHSPLFCPHLLLKNSHLHREISSRHLRNISILLRGFSWVRYLSRGGQRWNHQFGAAHRLVPAICPAGWAGTGRNLFCSLLQMEATKLASTSSSLIPSGPWEWIALHREILPQKLSWAELNQRNVFTPDWKHMLSISIAFQKCFTFSTAIKSKFSYLLALCYHPVPPWPTLTPTSLQALTDLHGVLWAHHHRWNL